jgi:hypothetical protein
MNRIDLQELSEIRIRESRALLDAGFSDGAYYLAGYAVECALKACIAKRTQEHDFPDKKLVNDSHTHNLKTLLQLAELKTEMDAAIDVDPGMESVLGRRPAGTRRELLKRQKRCSRLSKMGKEDYSRGYVCIGKLRHRKRKRSDCGTR